MCEPYLPKGLTVLIPFYEDMLVELLRREKHAGIKPDPDADIFMKVNYIFTSYRLLNVHSSELSTSFSGNFH
jgi:hypothetical protein